MSGEKLRARRILKSLRQIDVARHWAGDCGYSWIARIEGMRDVKRSTAAKYLAALERALRFREDSLAYVAREFPAKVIL